MKLLRVLALAGLALCRFAAASNLATGNGFGFAVVAPETATVTSFYPHPYSFVRPDARDPLSEGVATPNFIARLALGGVPIHDGTAVYEDDSQVVHIRSKAGEGFVFMPFGMARPLLVVAWEAGELSVEWKQPVKSRRDVGDGRSCCGSRASII